MRSGLPPAMAGGGAMRNGGAAAGGDDAPLGAGQLGQALADAFHQLVHVDEAARGQVHGALHFGKGLRAGDDGERAAGVDDGPHADGAVHIGAEIERGGDRLPDAAAQRLHGRQQPALAEQIPAAVAGPGLFDFVPERLWHGLLLTSRSPLRHDAVPPRIAGLFVIFRQFGPIRPGDAVEVVDHLAVANGELADQFLRGPPFARRTCR